MFGAGALQTGHANLNPSFHRPGIESKTGQSAPRIIFLSVIFFAVLSTAWLVGRDLLAPDTGVDHYRGMVRLAPDRQGQCEQFELDNRTGLIQPKGATPCGYDITTSVPARSAGPGSGSASGTMGRLNGISEHFKPR
jgi:hypothetical protein